MNNSTSYEIGKFIGKHRIFSCAIVVGIVIFYNLATVSTEPPRPNPVSGEVCDQMYTNNMATSSYWEASLSAAKCKNVNPKYAAMEKQAETLHYTQELAATKNDKPKRMKVVEAMLLHNIEAPPKDATEYAAYKKIEDKRQATQEARTKKSQGVSIGMTEQDARDSSWGRPRKINTTTRARGTSAQWVYDGGYLYFEDGILTGIHN